jgi:hypothetical protein
MGGGKATSLNYSFYRTVQIMRPYLRLNRPCERKVPLAYLYCDEEDLASIIEGSARLSAADRSTLDESIRLRR